MEYFRQQSINVIAPDAVYGLVAIGYTLESLACRPLFRIGARVRSAGAKSTA